MAVIEAKDNNHTVSEGLQQALGYAELLDVPCAFSSNGDGFASHDKTVPEGQDIETEFGMSAFPSPDEIWRRYKAFRGISDAQESLVTEPYFDDGTKKEPRYYQAEAINRVVEKVAQGDKRLLLVMATGTGKTYTIQDITLLISELFTDTLVTTNYDRLLEQVYDKGDGSHVQLLDGTTAMTVVPDPECVTLIKIHGDFADPGHCILGKAQYDTAYGAGALDLQLPVPKVLARFYRDNSLLFLGCNLRNDRTLQVFQATKLAAGDALLPQHFCIEQAPVQLADLTARNAKLARLGITAIWYPERQYQFVDDILRLAISELKYRESQVSRAQHFMRC